MTLPVSGEMPRQGKVGSPVRECPHERCHAHRVTCGQRTKLLGRGDGIDEHGLRGVGRCQAAVLSSRESIDQAPNTSLKRAGYSSAQVM